MNRAYDLLLTDIRALISDLGRDGGLIGPSVYDTAQVLRFSPPSEGVWPALEWLIEQQYPDGGWGDPSIPLSRDVATLAVVLALEAHSSRKNEQSAMQAGLTFIRRQAMQWAGPLPEDMPVACELLLPALVDQARERGITLDDAPYTSLRAFGSRRRQLLARLVPRPGTPLTHSWESWGQQPDVGLLDGAGSIGHSPAATAAWIRNASDDPNLADACDASRHYLRQAAAATGVGIPGVVGAVWPYRRNEQIVSLFTIMLAGLIDHPALRDVIQPQLDDLWGGLRPDGYGISDHFSTDGDLTAMSFALMAHHGQRPPITVLREFIVDDSCLTYKHEMQRSFSATTHAAHSLLLLGDDPTGLFDYLDRQRAINGTWLGDKWHASWLYLTSHVIHALLAAGRPLMALTALSPLLDHQHPDGSWGLTSATTEETAYGALALLALSRHGLLPEHGQRALRRATRYLKEHYRPLAEDSGACWIAKGLYRPRRIARIEETSVTLACMLAGYGE
jgi:hypothetical protein